MTSYSLEVVDLSKHFKLYKEKHTSIKEKLIRGMRSSYEEFWALRDVNIQVEPGETVGLLGHNGSGKSTLLKCMAGILQPTTGKVCLRGSVAALLELGAGFHPDLSGRDNIYLNASLLGLSKRQIDSKFEEIVEFSELSQFIDNQVKFYSSGMQARLGFAVAVNVDPDILLIDEVLAVGDENFQRKCIDRINQFQKAGKTIVFVTHAADSVRQICDKAFVLDHGKVVAFGAPGEAIRVFREYMMASSGINSPQLGEVLENNLVDQGKETLGTGDISIEEVVIESNGSGHILSGDPMRVRLHYNANRAINDAQFGVSIYSGNELFFSATSQGHGVDVGILDGAGEIVFDFATVPLLDGVYKMTFEVRGVESGSVYAWREQVDHFEVVNPGRDVGVVAFPVAMKVVSVAK